jgi:ABC-2 type transport system permease protein
MGGMFDAVNNIEGMEEMLASYPEELWAFFGDMINLNTPAGYFGTYYSSYMPVIVGIFAVAAAAGLLAGDEERGTLDLTLAYPIGRTALFWGRWAGFVVATTLIMLIGYAGWAVTLPFTSMDVTAWGLLQAHLPILALLLLFGGLALLLSMILPSARAAAMTAGGLLVANFLLAGLANLNEDLQPIMDVTPFAFFQGGEAINDLNWGWIAGLTAFAFVLAAAAWLLFRRRDIRVGGERGWSWRPRLRGADR